MPVCVIYSTMSLSAIRNHLLSFGPDHQIGSMRVVLDKENCETNRTICVLSRSILDKALAAGRTSNFSVAPYGLSPSNYPREGFTSNFYLPLPRTFDLSESTLLKQVDAKLTELVRFGDLPARSYRITFPKESRESSDLRGSCFVSFSRSVPLDAIALARVALDSTHWIQQTKDTELPLLEKSRCFWAFERKKTQLPTVPETRTL